MEFMKEAHAKVRQQENAGDSPLPVVVWSATGGRSTGRGGRSRVNGSSGKRVHAYILQVELYNIRGTVLHTLNPKP
jgi:hypothetical protein